jgi:hypothetical protein
MRGKPWTIEEKELLSSSMPLSELVIALPHRTRVALRSARSNFFPARRNRRRAREPVAKKVRRPRTQPWSKEELALLATGIHAKRILSKLHPSRNVWDVTHKRHKLGLAVPQIGRPPLSPTDFPGADWSLPVNVLKRSIGVAWVTAAKLKRMALGGVGDGCYAFGDETNQDCHTQRQSPPG